MGKAFVQFVLAALGAMVRGSWGYFVWMGALLAGIALGTLAYARQIDQGLVATGLSDAVPWGAYIGSFTCLAGLSAATALLGLLAQAHRDARLGRVVVLMELLAAVFAIMAGLCVVVDLGRPERAWHLFPGIGHMNWPASILAWDVFLIAGYVFFDVFLALYLLFKQFQGRPPTRAVLGTAAAFVAIWALAPITSFLYAGLAARPYWNSAILAPRFLASGLGSGAAFAILILSVVRRRAAFSIDDVAFRYLRQIAGWAVGANLFLYGAEVFAGVYSGRHHELAAFRYAFFGLRGQSAVVPYTWSALALDLVAATVLLVPRFRERRGWLWVGCTAAVAGGWIDKGVAFLVPGFVPTSLGQVASYSPNLIELGVSGGILAFGALLYTLGVKAAMAMEHPSSRPNPAH